MYRVGASHLRSFKDHTKRCVGTGAVVEGSRSSLVGLFNWLTGEKCRSLPSLDLPLTGINFPPPLSDYVLPGNTQISTLPNGFKIASETSLGPCVSIGLYVDSGSVYEGPQNSGSTHLLEKMAFKSTTNRSYLRSVRETEAIGGSVQVSASREQMGYTFDALKTYVPKMVELIIDSVRNPAFLDWEVAEQVKKLKDEIPELAKNPQGVLLEAIHIAGFTGALANPLMAPEYAINNLNSSVLEEFVTKNYTAPRMVLAACGVEHGELLSLAEPLLSDMPAVPLREEPKSVYVGGDYRCPDDSKVTHVTLAFKVPGGWHDEKLAIILTVLQMLMGGGGSFSAGGPGKGMHSRLYLRVLNAHREIQSFSAFNNIYNNTGIFGIYAASSHDFVPQLIDIIVNELLLIATPGEVSQVELDRAKKVTLSAIAMNLESRMVVQEDIGRQILTYGERKPVEYFFNHVKEVTLDDITRIAHDIISSPLTMASLGDVIPTYDSVKAKFNSDSR